ncbi:MAG: DNA polymerase III subunit chi [Rhizobiaceae bacterium]|jgi:DNA polymerase-3 subunit chi|nr:DNA polymerase III subunit chi [Rhizobiaceae bacterium]
MPEIWFYHLTESRLEDALPPLLEKTLERGWRAVVELGSEERMNSLNDHLWTWRDDSFLPHGMAGDGNEALQPVLLTTSGINPNHANVRFHADGALPQGVSGYDRAIVLFDGHDNDQLQAARAAWKALKAEGAEMSYWQQNPSGRWERKA